MKFKDYVQFLSGKLVAIHVKGLSTIKNEEGSSLIVVGQMLCHGNFVTVGACSHIPPVAIRISDILMIEEAQAVLPEDEDEDEEEGEIDHDAMLRKWEQEHRKGG